jgi:hypothetical protein
VSAPTPLRRGRRGLAAALLAAATLAFPSQPAGAVEGSTLVGGEALGRGIFVTYSDQDTVIEGGTVAPPDFSAPVARAALDLTGLGTGLASLAYSPYNDAAGVINAFGGTDLPLSSFSEASRAKVRGTPPQEHKAAAPGPPGAGAWARLSDGPTVEAAALAMATPSGAPLAVRIGDVHATVRRSGPTVGSMVSVVLRAVAVGEVVTFDSITLTASATADGADGLADATSLVEGVAVAGQPVRLTSGGIEPLGTAAPPTDALAAAGVEIVSAGETEATPGGQQSEARASGPRIRLRTADGRILTLVVGEAVASSTFSPPPGG